MQDMLKLVDLIKILGNGELKAKSKLKQMLSQSAEAAIKAVGGNATII